MVKSECHDYDTAKIWPNRYKFDGIGTYTVNGDIGISCDDGFAITNLPARHIFCLKYPTFYFGADGGSSRIPATGFF